MNSSKRINASQASRSLGAAAPRKWPNASPQARPFGSSLKSTGFGASRGMRGSCRISRLVTFAMWLAFVIALAVAGRSLIDGLLSMPYVHTSHSTGECVAVYAPDGTDLGCSSKPERYHHVWVE